MAPSADLAGGAGEIVRLCWLDGRGTGTAHFDGVLVRLRCPPIVPGLPDGVTEIDFFSQQGELRIDCNARRELSGAECIAVIAFLDRMAAAARRVAEGSG